ncbi:hypothetical protein PENSUB_13631 [Penicillium subrubescens]|uniref:Uncharacterized protein n=1 Tax=Penicillium subrubescens TaxID=1316194 RepID=A0A1Q5SNW1_9EURO|nr:hypothetical protein PENSUB_13631 [Penicillium subrubescens]
MSSYNRQNNAYRGGTQTSPERTRITERGISQPYQVVTAVEPMASTTPARLFYPAQDVYDLKTLDPSNSASDKPA